MDLVAFEAAANRGLKGDRAALQAAADLYKGDLLPDCAGEWIDADRERLRLQARQVLVRLVGLLERDRAFGDAIERAQQLLRLDPLDEQAWCALMRCHARRGERATALHLYQQCTALLKKELGVQPSAATRITYREILDIDAETPVIQAPPRTAVYPLVGRQSEWQALLNAWRIAAAGRTRLFLIRGEAGIGKSRLAEELVDWSRLNGITPVPARCYAGEGRLAYAPIAAWLKSDALRPSLMKLDPSWMTDVARLRAELLVDRPEVPAPDRQLENWQRLRFFEALAQAFRSAAPLVLVVDDLQWADGDTIEWLQYFVRSASDTRCLVVATVRAEEEQDNPPLGRLLGHLERDSLLTTITLGPLDRTATAQLAGEVAGHLLDETVLARTSTKPKVIPCSLSNVDGWNWSCRWAPPAASCHKCSPLSPRDWRCSRTKPGRRPRLRRQWDAISGSTFLPRRATSRKTRSSAPSTSSGGATSSAFKPTSDGTSAMTASAKWPTAESDRHADASSTGESRRGWSFCSPTVWTR